MKVFLPSLLLLWLDQHSVQGLSCPPPRSGPTNSPVCCTSGYVTTGPCGVSAECAKAEDDTCGGPWNTQGLCARNLQCLIKCPCYAKGAPYPNNKCIFPFKYQGKEYDSCTTANSENNEAWCAYEVDKDGVVVEGKWGDCEGGGCGIAGGPVCSENSFNYDGKCVRKTPRPSGAIIGLGAKPNTYDLRDGIEGGDTIKRCQAPAEQFQCRCADRSTCKTVDDDGDDGSNYDYYGGGPDYGWCWLENLYDQAEPASFCYDDVYYSRRHGRFYSSKACNPSEEPLDKEYKFTLDEDVLCEGPPGSCGGDAPPVVFDE